MINEVVKARCGSCQRALGAKMRCECGARFVVTYKDIAPDAGGENGQAVAIRCPECDKQMLLRMRCPCGNQFTVHPNDLLHRPSVGAGEVPTAHLAQGQTPLRRAEIVSEGPPPVATAPPPAQAPPRPPQAPPRPAQAPPRPAQAPAKAAAKPAPPPPAPKPAPPKPGGPVVPPEVARAMREADRHEQSDIEMVQTLQKAHEAMKGQLARIIIGQKAVIDEVLVAMFCRGHVLLKGVPGLAKTLLVSSLSRVLDLNFRRIQFTPDLMPSDITGTDVLEEDQTTGKRVFRFVHGPVFTNMLLADEINRTPPKTQAALLEAMQERHVTVGERTFPLDEPFFVMATQNPIEQEGTYPLPEAQLDRFMFNIVVDYPERLEEREIIRMATGSYEADLDVTLTGEDIVKLQGVVRRVPVADHVLQYAADLARASRPKSPDAPDFVKEMVGWGAGPRAGIYLILAAKARAILNGRFHATTEDVRFVAPPVLRHRVLTTFNAEAAGITSDDIIEQLLAYLPGTDEEADMLSSKRRKGSKART